MAITIQKSADGNSISITEPDGSIYKGPMNSVNAIASPGTGTISIYNNATGSAIAGNRLFGDFINGATGIAFADLDSLITFIVTNFFRNATGGGGGGAVTSVNSKTGIVTIGKSDVGLGNVDNTSDANKPVSTAQAAAISAATSGGSSIKKGFGLLVPQFKSALKFDNIGSALGTAFAIHSSGNGLISSSGGTTASGYLKLNIEVTGRRTTRTDWLVSWDTTESGASMTFGLGTLATGYTVNIANVGANVVFTAHDATTFTAPVSGTVLFSISFTTGNGSITSSASLLGIPTLTGTTNVFRVPCFAVSKVRKTGLYYAYQATNTVTSKITGMLHNSFSYDGDPTAQLLTQTVIRDAAGSANEHDNIIVIPARSSPSTPLRVLHYFHGRTLTYKSMIDVSVCDAGETARRLINAGYAYISTSGGLGNTTSETDYWGNAWGVEKAHQLFDVLQDNVKNIGKEYLFGISMGGTSILNYARTYPDNIAAMEGNCPVTDLEETGSSLAIQTQATLKNSLDLAYCSWYYSLASANTNDPQTLTNWSQVSAPGGQPLADMRGISAATVASTVTASSTVALTMIGNTRFFPGDYVYFKASRISARVLSTSSGVPSSITLDGPVTLIAGEFVNITRPYNFGWDFQWQNRPNLEWTASSSGIYIYQKRKSATPELDVRPNNPTRFFDFYAELGIPIAIRVGDSGGTGSSGNDGILNNAPMYAFQAGVNALNTGLVTLEQRTGAHTASSTFNPAGTVTFFNTY